MNIKAYFLLLFCSILSIVMVPLWIPAGGITADSISYFRLANDLPHAKWSLFPLGYPLLLKVFHLFTNDFFWSSRILNCLLYTSIALFAYWRKFYFKETVILLTTKIFFFSFFNAISEGLWLAVFYLLIYYLNGFFSGKIKGSSFIIPAACCLIFSFVVRYSSIYIGVAMGLFYLIFYYKQRNEINFWKHDFFKFLLVSCLGIVAYCMFNYFSFGDFMGERYRNAPPTLVWENIIRNIASVFNSFNPILGIKLNGNSTLIVVIELFLGVINISFIYLFYKVWRDYFKNNKGYFHLLLILCGLVYTGFLFVTQFYQGIEELNMRMLAESSFFYFISVIILYYKNLKFEKIIFCLAIISLLFNSLYVLKIPSDYLKRKSEVENFISHFKDKEYFYDDLVNEGKVVKYKLPLVNKDIEYKHVNQQDGYIDGNILMAKNPKIEWIVEDTVKDKSRVVYASDLTKKKNH